MGRLADPTATSAPASAFGALLRHWRLARRISQLTLATEAEVSARHLCFLEIGRAQPSREMVQLLAGVLDVSLGDRNAMLLAAGYAPVYGQRGLDVPEVEHVRRAFEFILQRFKIEIRYRSTLGEAMEPAEFVAALERRRGEELRRKQTMVGPHRDLHKESKKSAAEVARRRPDG